MSELPAGWVRICLDDIAADEPRAITDGPFGSNLKTEHYQASGPRVIRLQNIGEARFIDEEAHISQEHFASLRQHQAKAGDILVAMLGETLPRACLVPPTLGPAIVKADCARVRVNPTLALGPFVSYALNSDPVRREAAKLIHGVGRPRLGLTLLRTIQVPLAPLGEQRSVVEAIESHLSRLDETVALLERVQRNLARYRASVLTAAVEGRLVPTEAELARAEKRDYEPASALLKRILAERRRRWEEATLERLRAHGQTPKGDGWKAKYEEPDVPDTSSLPDLPKGWCWATVDQLSTEVRYGSSAKCLEELEGGVPVFRMGNIVNGELRTDSLKYLPRNHAEFPELLLLPGDLLFNRTNSAELVGKSAVYRGQENAASCASYLIRVRFAEDGLSDYVAAYLNSSHGRRWIADVVTQQVGQANVNGTKLRACAIPLAPRVEQSRILSEIERVFSNVAAALDVARRNEKRCSRLRQSILKWAFEGKLVDQDPGDEPASDLLARIRAEKNRDAPVSAASAPRRTKRKA